MYFDFLQNQSLTRLPASSSKTLLGYLALTTPEAIKIPTSPSSIYSPFGVVKGTKILGVNPIKAARLSEDAFEFGLRHETKEIEKESLRAAGKIPTEKEITKMVDKLDMSEAAKKELTETIEERLIADYLVLKEDPRMVKGWMEESEDVIRHVNNMYILPKGEVYIKTNLPELAYIKALNLPSDNFVRKEADEFISNLSSNNKKEFDAIFAAMREVLSYV